MNIDTGKKLTSPFLLCANSDRDAAFVAHFSRLEDYFEGRFVNMKDTDALLLIKHLTEQFGIEPKRLVKYLTK